MVQHLTVSSLLAVEYQLNTSIYIKPLNFDLMFANSLFMRFSSASLLLPAMKKICHSIHIWLLHRNYILAQLA